MQLGKIDVIFGPSNAYYFSVDPNQGIKPE